MIYRKQISSWYLIVSLVVFLLLMALFLRFLLPLIIWGVLVYSGYALLKNIYLYIRQQLLKEDQKARKFNSDEQGPEIIEVDAEVIDED